MPRIRTLKPEIWNSRDFMALSPHGQLVFIALITQADDEGRLETDPLHLQQVAVRGIPAGEIKEQMAAMAKSRMLVAYEVEGRPYVQLLSWPTHQKVDHPKPSALPSPPQITTKKPRERSRKGVPPAENPREDSRDLANDLEESRTFSASRAPADRIGSDL